MGVKGLWQLLDSSGRPIRLETLEGKTLAIDVSIWLNQLVKGYRGSGGAAVETAHLIGLFNRVCKLLHFKIKPVFVFDGEAPALKYQTLASRKRKRDDGSEAIKKASQKMLEIYLKQKLLGEANPKLPKTRPTKEERRDEMFKLPDLATPLDIDSDESISDTDVTHNADLASIKVDSKEFASLPKELQHQFLVALKECEKKCNVAYDELPVDGEDFSSYQMRQVLKKNKLQTRIQEVQKEMNDGLMRMASDASVQVVLKVSQTTPEKVKSEKDEDDESEASPSKKPKLEPMEPSVKKVMTEKQKKIHDFLVLQWLEGAQKGEVNNETLMKAVELVQQEDVQFMSDSDSSTEELPPTRQRLLSGGGKVTAEEAMKLMEDSREPESLLSSPMSRNTLPSDSVSLEVAHGSIQSSITERMILPDNAYDEGSQPQNPDDNPDPGIIDSVGLMDPTNEHFSNDILNADLEVSETGNSLFKTDNLVERRSRSQEEQSTESSQSCKLTEVQLLTGIETVSFSVAVSTSLNSNDDIVLPQKLSRYTSKEPSRCNSNSIGACAAIVSPPADNPTDFHQALEIIKEQERRQSICAESKESTSDTKNVCTLTDDTTATNGTPDTTTASPTTDGITEEKSQSLDIQNNNEAGSTDDPKTSLVDAYDADTIEQGKEDLVIQSTALQNEINRIQRQTNEVTTSMVDECEELLRLFGIPVVRAPCEAEAQCAALEASGLVNGVVTDDSDIFLFGGQTVYRNMFATDKHCEIYTARNIESRFGMQRDDLIGFAMLTGSDYTNGVETVGAVTACEILSEFKNGKNCLNVLTEFKEWWQLTQKGAAPPKNAIRHRLSRLYLDEKFPSAAVYNAYKQPSVAFFNEKFTWNRPDLDLLRKFTAQKFNWTQAKADEHLLPIVKKFEDRSTQLRIDGLLLPKIAKRENLFPSKRVKAAVSKIREQPVFEAKLSESSSSDSD